MSNQNSPNEKLGPPQQDQQRRLEQQKREDQEKQDQQRKDKGEPSGRGPREE